MEIDSPDVVAEVTSAFERYERAINANDVATLNELFWNSPRTVRYGTGEQLYGYEAIPAVAAAHAVEETEQGTMVAFDERVQAAGVTALQAEGESFVGEEGVMGWRVGGGRHRPPF